MYTLSMASIFDSKIYNLQLGEEMERRELLSELKKHLKFLTHNKRTKYTYRQLHKNYLSQFDRIRILTGIEGNQILLREIFVEIIGKDLFNAMKYAEKMPDDTISTPIEDILSPPLGSVRVVTYDLKVHSFTVDEQTTASIEMQRLQMPPEGDPFGLKNLAPALHFIERTAKSLHPNLSKKDKKDNAERIRNKLKKVGAPFNDPTVLKYAIWFIDPYHSFGIGNAGSRCFKPERLAQDLIKTKYSNHPHINKGLISLIEIFSWYISEKEVNATAPISMNSNLRRKLESELDSNFFKTPNLKLAAVQLIDWSPAREKESKRLASQ